MEHRADRRPTTRYALRLKIGSDIFGMMRGTARAPRSAPRGWVAPPPYNLSRFPATEWCEPIEVAPSTAMRHSSMRALRSLAGCRS